MDQTQDSGLLVKMEISNLIKFADKFAGIEVHLPVNGKFVKLNYAQEVFVDILRKLQQKEVTEVYITEADSNRVVEHIAQAMSSQSFYDPKTIAAQRVEQVSAAMETVKGIINQLGVEPETVRLLKTINTRAMTLLSEAPSIFAFIKQFKKNCSEEFLLGILTNYIMSLTIDRFPWKSEQVKEKGALASMMCDMVLSKDDFKVLRHWEQNGGDLPERIRRHPADIAESLKKNRLLIPIETITIIEQHHELPDGKGFPHGITANRFNQLSTIFIVSQQFTGLLHEAEYDYERRGEIISKIRSKYGSSKMFDKAIDALVQVVG
jgi:response regulator RpfG family c-di-GMP phosphodiesterase